MSLRLQLEAHFTAFDDDESMTVEDAAEKWGVELSSARRALDKMAADGVLDRFEVRSSKINRMVAAYRRASKVPA